MRSVLIQANAKINLSLNILTKRADGYHEVDSVFQSIDLADFLLIEKGRNQLSGSCVCPEPDNIVVLAKKILEKDVGRKLPAKIHLHKSIPVVAGLGGGSADAAAALFGLNLIYNLKLKKEELAKIGSRVGADVPFFFYGGTCRVSGKGEVVKKVKMKMRKFFVLFRPHQRISSRTMYGLHDKTGDDFLTLAENICPEIKKIKKHFNKFNLKLHLSGSGPTTFCGTDNYLLAKKIANAYPEFNGDVFVCHTQNEALRVLQTN